MARRYNHERMTAQEFSAALDRLGLTASQFQRLTGVTYWTVLKWLDPNCDRNEGGDVPHWACVLLEVLALPEAMEIARRVTDERVIDDREPRKEQI